MVRNLLGGGVVLPAWPILSAVVQTLVFLMHEFFSCLVTSNELAEALGVSTRTARRILASLRPPKLGAHYAIPPDVVRMLALAQARRLVEVSAHSADRSEHSLTPGGTGHARGPDTGARGSPRKKIRDKAGRAAEEDQGNQGNEGEA